MLQLVFDRKKELPAPTERVTKEELSRTVEILVHRSAELRRVWIERENDEAQIDFLLQEVC
jgi:hypothetical protein